jgi:beta-glucosidase
MNGPESVFWSHYTDVANTPLYPFGYGLSYTTFEYSNLRLNKATMTADEIITVSVDLRNTGTVDGKEVAQLYIRDIVGSSTRPIRELKGFEMVELAAGQMKTVEFRIDRKLIEYYTVNNKWEAEPGDFKVYVGGSSDATMEAGFTLTSDQNTSGND